MYARSRGEPKKKKKHAKKKRKQYSSSDSEASEDDPVDAKQHAADHVAFMKITWLVTRAKLCTSVIITTPSRIHRIPR